MSSVFEEILTSSVGFIIAVVILVAAVAGGLYGYWVYSNHVTLENYLWPVAEVLPYQGEYFLGIVNTGHEPFTIEQIYLKGGGAINPGQAGNPNLSWCSTSNTELTHNEWWCGEVNQLPVAVMVCSALNPSVCVVTPVHGWQVVTFSQPQSTLGGGGNSGGGNGNGGGGNGGSGGGGGGSGNGGGGGGSGGGGGGGGGNNNDYVYITVTGDTCGADWQIISSNGGVLTGTNDVSNDPLYIDGNPSVTLDASILVGSATISPTSTTAQPGQSVTFTVSCSNGGNNPPPPPPPPPSNNYYVYVTVTGDSYGAIWQIGSSVDSISGSGNVNNEQLQIGGPTDTLTASVTSPSGYTCTISPSSEQVSSGNSYTFTVNCQENQQPPNYYVYVTVTGDSSGAGWQIGSSVSSISGTGNTNNEQLQIGGQTDTLTAQITSNPNGYQCTISPSSESVSAGYSYTFTVSCTQPSSGNIIYVTVYDDDGAGWEVSSSITSIGGSSSVSNAQLVIGGTEDWVSASITNNPLGYVCSIQPSNEQVVAGGSYTFSVTCGTAYVYVTVNDNYNVNWSISSSVASISGSSSVSGQQLQIAGPSDTLTATVQGGANLGGFWYQCKISPSSTSVDAYNSYTFTINCSPASKV